MGLFDQFISKKKSSLKLKKKTLKMIVKKTHFTEEEVTLLFDYYCDIAASQEDDALIDRDEFEAVLGLKPCVFVDRLFAIFDQDGNGTIDFTEFCVCLSIFSDKASRDEKINWSFKLYDLDGDKELTKDEMVKLLTGQLKGQSLRVSEKQIAELVDATFMEAQTAKDNVISEKEYVALCVKNPNMIAHMTLHAAITKKPVKKGSKKRR